MSGRFFFSASGVRISFEKDRFRECDVVLDDISQHLSRLRRFGGASATPYSVLQHSLVVAELLPQHLRRPGLLHDAAEAYIGDVVAPLKDVLPGLRLLEDDFLRVIFRALGVPYPPAEEWATVKDADQRAFASEARLFGPPGLWTFHGMVVDEAAECRVRRWLGASESECIQCFTDGLNS